MVRPKRKADLSDEEFEIFEDREDGGALTGRAFHDRPSREDRMRTRKRSAGGDAPRPPRRRAAAAVAAMVATLEPDIATEAGEAGPGLHGPDSDTSWDEHAASQDEVGNDLAWGTDGEGDADAKAHLSGASSHRGTRVGSGKKVVPSGASASRSKGTRGKPSRLAALRGTMRRWKPTPCPAAHAAGRQATAHIDPLPALRTPSASSPASATVVRLKLKPPAQQRRQEQAGHAQGSASSPPPLHAQHAKQDCAPTACPVMPKQQSRGPQPSVGGARPTHPNPRVNSPPGLATSSHDAQLNTLHTPPLPQDALQTPSPQPLRRRAVHPRHPRALSLAAGSAAPASSAVEDNQHGQGRGWGGGSLALPPPRRQALQAAGVAAGGVGAGAAALDPAARASGKRREQLEGGRLAGGTAAGAAAGPHWPSRPDCAPTSRPITRPPKLDAARQAAVLAWKAQQQGKQEQGPEWKLGRKQGEGQEEEDAEKKKGEGNSSGEELQAPRQEREREQPLAVELGNGRSGCSSSAAVDQQDTSLPAGPDRAASAMSHQDPGDSAERRAGDHASPTTCVAERGAQSGEVPAVQQLLHCSTVPISQGEPSAEVVVLPGRAQLIPSVAAAEVAAGGLLQKATEAAVVGPVPGCECGEGQAEATVPVGSPLAAVQAKRAGEGPPMLGPTPGPQMPATTSPVAEPPMGSPPLTLECPQPTTTTTSAAPIPLVGAVSLSAGSALQLDGAIPLVPARRAQVGGAAVCTTPTLTTAASQAAQHAAFHSPQGAPPGQQVVPPGQQGVPPGQQGVPPGQQGEASHPHAVALSKQHNHSPAIEGDHVLQRGGDHPPPMPAGRPSAAEQVSAADLAAKPHVAELSGASQILSPPRHSVHSGTARPDPRRPPATSLQLAPAGGGVVAGADVAQMWQLAAAHAAACGASPGTAWQEVQRVVLQATLRGLVGAVKRMKPPPVNLEKLSSGVSYVIPTESDQKGVEHLDPLPHLVIRPPGLREVGCVAVSEALATLQGQPTLGSVVPLKDENLMKSYLLWPARRTSLLAEHGGRVQLVPGTNGLEGLLQDRAFVCLHYFMDAAGKLHPCQAQATHTWQHGVEEGGRHRYGVAESNVQLGVMIRKGVGGTCPLRAASRQLSLSGLLPALMDEPPPRQQPPRPTPTPLPNGPPANPCAPVATPAARTDSAGEQEQSNGTLPPINPGRMPAPAVGKACSPASPPSTLTHALLPAGQAVPTLDQRASPLPSGPPPLPDGSCASSKEPSAQGVAIAVPQRRLRGGESEEGQFGAARQGAGDPAATPGKGEGTAAHVGSGDVVLEAGVPKAQVQGEADVAGDLAEDDVAAGLEGEEGVEELLQEMELEGAGKAARVGTTGGGAECEAHSLATSSTLPTTTSCPPVPPQPLKADAADGTTPTQQALPPPAHNSAPPCATPSGSAGSAGTQQQQSVPSMGTQHAQWSTRGLDQQAQRAGCGLPSGWSTSKLSMYTYSSRLELYVEEGLWGRLNGATRNVLHSAVRELERRILGQLASLNHRRLLELCTQLQSAVGEGSLRSSLARAILPPTLEHSQPAPLRPAEPAPLQQPPQQAGLPGPAIQALHSTAVPPSAHPHTAGTVPAGGADGGRDARLESRAEVLDRPCSVSLVVEELKGEVTVVRLSLQLSPCAAGAACTCDAAHVAGGGEGGGAAGKVVREPAGVELGPAGAAAAAQAGGKGIQKGGGGCRQQDAAGGSTAGTAQQAVHGQATHLEPGVLVLRAPQHGAPGAAPADSATPASSQAEAPPASAPVAPPAPSTSQPLVPRQGGVEAGEGAKTATPTASAAVPSNPSQSLGSCPTAAASHPPLGSPLQVSGLPAHLVLVPVLGQIPGAPPGQIQPMLVPMPRALVPPALLGALELAAHMQQQQQQQQQQQRLWSREATAGPQSAASGVWHGTSPAAQSMQLHGAQWAALAPAAAALGRFPAHKLSRPLGMNSSGRGQFPASAQSSACAAGTSQGTGRSWPAPGVTAPRHCPTASGTAAPSARVAHAGPNSNSPTSAVEVNVPSVPVLRYFSGTAGSHPLGFSQALVMAAACLAAAETVGGVRGFQFPWPYYLISTRDCFTHHLVPLSTQVTRGGRSYLKTEYFFRKGEVPEGFFAYAPPSLQPPSTPQHSLDPGSGQNVGGEGGLPPATGPSNPPTQASAIPPTRPQQSPVPSLSCAHATAQKEQCPGGQVEQHGTGGVHASMHPGPEEGQAGPHQLQAALLSSPGSSAPASSQLPSGGRGPGSLEPPAKSRPQDSGPQQGGRAAPGDALRGASAAAGSGEGAEVAGPPTPEKPPGGGPKPSGMGQGGAAKEGKEEWRVRGLLPVGMTTYTEIFSPAELAQIEASSDTTDMKAREGRLPESCFHTSHAKGGGLKRTKFFFGARYMWTKEQLAERDAHVAAGVRVDVPAIPPWMKDRVEEPLVGCDVIPSGFVDSIALNMYHDGSEGIQSHFDDAARFARPIYSLRLFSDSRLSFGTQLYGYTNGAFCVPLPRGCVAVMEEGSYAANAVKHCVRPMDMQGKSAGMILRRIHPSCRREAERHWMEESTRWMAALSLNASTPRPSLPSAQHAQRAQQHGAGRGRPPVAGVRKEVARVVEGMVRWLEREERRQHADSLAVAATVMGLVRKVEAADRMDVDLTQEGASQCFSLVDDIVAWVENPAANRPLALPSCQHKSEARKSVGTDAEEVGKVMARMLRQLEGEERRMELQVKEVVSSLVHFTEAMTGWESSGRSGPPPTFAASSAVCAREAAAAAGRDPSLPRPPKKKRKKINSAAGHDVAPALPPTAILPLAAHLAGRVLLGVKADGKVPEGRGPASGGSAADASFDATVQVLLVRFGLQSEAALRHAVLTSVGAQALGDTGGSAGAEASRAPTLTMGQFQAAVGVLAGMLSQLSTADAEKGTPGGSTSAASSQQSGGGHSGAGNAPPRDGLPPSRPLKKAKARGVAMGGAGMQGGCQPVSVHKAPPFICFSCHKGVHQEGSGGDELWSCQGPCRRTFHLRCSRPAEVVASGMCTECANRSHTCFACGQPGGLVSKCSMGQCSRHYHWDCVASNPLTRVAPSGKSLKCPLHYCAECGLSGDGIPMVQCMMCPSGFHIRCRPANSRILSKKFIVCSHHMDDV